MNHQLKKNIRKLAEKFSYTIQYEKEVIKLNGSVYKIKIESKHTEELTVRYSSLKRVEKLNIPQAEIYDILLQLLPSTEIKRIVRKEGTLITLDLYREEEGKNVDQWLKQLKTEISTQGITQKTIGGNRILAECDKGLLILRDDLAYYLSNVIEI